jgi:hypothetical protein
LDDGNDGGLRIDLYDHTTLFNRPGLSRVTLDHSYSTLINDPYDNFGQICSLISVVFALVRPQKLGMTMNTRQQPQPDRSSNGLCNPPLVHTSQSSLLPVLYPAHLSGEARQKGDILVSHEHILDSELVDDINISTGDFRKHILPSLRNSFLLLGFAGEEFWRVQVSGDEIELVAGEILRACGDGAFYFSGFGGGGEKVADSRASIWRNSVKELAMMRWGPPKRAFTNLVVEEE